MTHLQLTKIIAYEVKLGLCEKGKGGRLAESGVTSLGGEIPVNTSGGLKGKGHPIGCSGIGASLRSLSATFWSNTRSKKSKKGARSAMTHSMGEE